MPASYSWLKLYYEIIDDPKMGKLPDRLWRRVIECFLLAGRHGKNGELPDLFAMAWSMRTDEKELEAELNQIETTGIISKTEGVWHVSNFAKRQEAAADRERKLAERDRKRHDFSHEPVTARDTSCHEPVTARDTELEERRGEEDIEGERDKKGASAPPAPSKPERVTEYPTIAIIKKITGKRSIPISMYETLCDTLGSAPDEVKLKACWVAWNAKGYRPDNWAWALEWYKTGIPTNGHGNGNGSKPRPNDGPSIAANFLAKVMAEEAQNGE